MGQKKEITSETDSWRDITRVRKPPISRRRSEHTLCHSPRWAARISRICPGCRGGVHGGVVQFDRDIGGVEGVQFAVRRTVVDLAQRPQNAGAGRIGARRQRQDAARKDLLAATLGLRVVTKVDPLNE